VSARAAYATVGVAIGVAALSLAGCMTERPAEPLPPTAPSGARPPLSGTSVEPPAVQDVPDAVPRVEPRSRYGNPPFYEVFGKRYYVLSSSADYVERGVASWYGPGFHQILTSTREPYDMYAMTAAHKTLPLPAYARVTNLENGRSVVVRVNDRGPFVGNRLIDLSYTAAAKLDMLRNGTAMVEVRSIDPSAAVQSAAPLTTIAAAPAEATPAGAPLFVQAGAFADPANAEHLLARLQSGNYGTLFIRQDVIAGRKMYRVRIGPVPSVAEFDRIVAALETAGVHDAHLALN
jgi:rare lipoprotein A